MTHCLDFARFAVSQALFHLKAGVAHLGDAALADDVIMETYRIAEIKVDVDKNIFKGKPVDWCLELMLEETASTHVEKVALRPVVDVVVWVKGAHADLDGTRKHFQLTVDS